MILRPTTRTRATPRTRGGIEGRGSGRAPWTPESDRYQPPGVRQAARQRKDIMGPRNEWGYERGPAHPDRAPRLPSEVWGLAWSYLGLPERAAAGSQGGQA